MDKSRPTLDAAPATVPGDSNDIQKNHTAPPAKAAPEAAHPQGRTAGLKLFDVLLYPIFTNVAVFGISVGATYLTSRGASLKKYGKFIGGLGEWFQGRGDWMMNKFKGLGMSDSQADMSKMVFFSFADGSAMAPFVKMFEDRRESIGRWLDEKMGTVPQDDSVYAAEPKQTWLSVLGGRFLTAAIVVPTAVMLDKIKVKGTGGKDPSLNDYFFNDPGEKWGAWLQKQPSVTKVVGNTDLKELSRIGFFEAFYTSVCTAGLYLSSRCIARITNDKKHREEHGIPHVPGITTDAAPADTANAELPPETATPIVLRAQEDLKRPARLAIPIGSFREKYEAEPASSHAAAI